MFDENVIHDLPMKEVFLDESFNCRGRINPLTVLELAKEIAQNGLIQPITVQPYDKKPPYKYRILAGHRRYTAHLLNNADTIKSVIKVHNAQGQPISDTDARLINLNENTQREDLTVMQGARAIEHFYLAGWNIDEIAKRTGKPNRWVEARICLLELPTEIQDDADSGLISQADIIKIHGVKDYGIDAMRALHLRIKENKLLGNKKEVVVKTVVKENEKKVRTETEIFEMQETIQQASGNASDPMAKALAWAAGVIDDKELHIFLKAYVRMRYNKHHSMPQHLIEQKFVGVHSQNKYANQPEVLNAQH